MRAFTPVQVDRQGCKGGVLVNTFHLSAGKDEDHCAALRSLRSCIDLVCYRKVILSR